MIWKKTQKQQPQEDSAKVDLRPIVKMRNKRAENISVYV